MTGRMLHFILQSKIVACSQIEDMWNIADTDRDGFLSYQEFCVGLWNIKYFENTLLHLQVMINPPAPPEIPKLTIWEKKSALFAVVLEFSHLPRGDTAKKWQSPTSISF